MTNQAHATTAARLTATLRADIDAGLDVIGESITAGAVTVEVVGKRSRTWGPLVPSFVVTIA